MSASGTITGIHHINITVSPEQEAACAHFYGDLLGLGGNVKPEEAGRSGGWFKVGATELHMSTEAGADGSISRRHVCFMVTGLDHFKARLIEAGCPIQEKGPVNGLRRFFVRDPAGNRIELTEPC